MSVTTKRRALSVGAAVAVLACGGALAWALAGAGTPATTANAEGAPQLGNTLGGNDTTVRGSCDVYDPEVEAGHVGGTSIEGSEEEKLQQERIAGGAVGEVVSKNLPELDGIVNEDKDDYVPVYGDELQAPGLSQAVLDAVESGELAGLPKSHLTARLGIDTCATCHTVA